MSRTILAVDPGKHKGVARACRAASRPAFASPASTPEALRPCRRHRPDVGAPGGR